MFPCVSWLQSAMWCTIAAVLSCFGLIHCYQVDRHANIISNLGISPVCALLCGLFVRSLTHPLRLTANAQAQVHVQFGVVYGVAALALLLLHIRENDRPLIRWASIAQSPWCSWLCQSKRQTRTWTRSSRGGDE